MTPIRLHIPSYQPGLSVDCVIFGFHNGELKVLLLQMKNMDKWALPGGFVGVQEDVDLASSRVLKERTGVDQVYLQQFHLFGSTRRDSKAHVDELIANGVIDSEGLDWFSQRFVTVGYYALIDFVKATPVPDSISDRCEWVPLEQVPALILDHREILDRALEALRKEIRYVPIGINLLPQKFTMPELQTLYETILNRRLDRRNFQRKMLGFDFLVRHEKRQSGGAHRAPYLYSFDREKYAKALATGLGPDW